MEMVKSVESLELKDATIRKKNKELMRRLSTVGYSTCRESRFKFTTIIHRVISKYIEKREYDHDCKREVKFAHQNTELHDGTIIRGLEYEQYYTKVVCYIKPFTLLSFKLNLKYEVYVPSFSQLRIDKRLNPIYKPGLGIPYGGGLKYHHIGNTQVTKEEYEAYKSSKVK